MYIIREFIKKLHEVIPPLYLQELGVKFTPLTIQPDCEISNINLYRKTRVLANKILYNKYTNQNQYIYKNL